MGTVDMAADLTIVTGTYVASSDHTPRVARKTAATIRNNTATRTSDPDLTLAVEAGAVYEVESEVIYDGSTSADLQFGWALPASSTFLWGTIYATPSSTDVNSTSSGYVVRNESGSIAIGAGGIGNLTTARMSGVLTVGSAGSIALQWAQGTAEATNIRLFQQSTLKLRRIG